MKLKHLPMSLPSNICVSLANLSFSELMDTLQKYPLAEVRMDLLNLTNQQYAEVFASHGALIATYRAGAISEQERAQQLIHALNWGAAFVDLEMETTPVWRLPIVTRAKELNRRVILSYHNYSSTPTCKELYDIADSLFDSGADIAKIACMVNLPSDNAKILSLYAKYANIVAIGMGQGGQISRIAAPILGAPFTFAAIAGKETAPGQLTQEQLQELFHLVGYKE